MLTVQKAILNISLHYERCQTCQFYMQPAIYVELRHWVWCRMAGWKCIYCAVSLSYWFPAVFNRSVCGNTSWSIEQKEQQNICWHWAVYKTWVECCNVSTFWKICFSNLEKKESSSPASREVQQAQPTRLCHSLRLFVLVYRLWSRTLSSKLPVYRRLVSLTYFNRAI